MKVAILVNRSANAGRGGSKWDKIRQKVLEQMEGQVMEISYTVPFDMTDTIKELVEKEGVRRFISAGGDGSLNHLLNALVASKGEALSDFCIGSVGVGSSNDLHFHTNQQIGKIPVRIDRQNVKPYDLGKIRYVNKKGDRKTHYFLLHASFGILASGNRIFNESDKLLDWLKYRSMDAAIAYTAIKALFRYQNIPLHVSYDGIEKNAKFTNISIAKTPLISGRFLFDRQIKPADGKLGVYMVEDLNKIQIINTVADLLRGRFGNKSGQMKRYVNKIHIKSSVPIDLETDGEHLSGTSFDVTVIPGAINVMG